MHPAQFRSPPTEDPSVNKEYKVITSNTPAFMNQQKLKETLAEEAAAGWDLEEVIDANKIRVGRDKGARANDANCKLNPYRIHVGMNSALYLGIAAVITIVVIYAIIQAAAYSVR
jgi:hypothetical protein